MSRLILFRFVALLVFILLLNGCASNSSPTVRNIQYYEGLGRTDGPPYSPRKKAASYVGSEESAHMYGAEKIGQLEIVGPKQRYQTLLIGRPDFVDDTAPKAAAEAGADFYWLESGEGHIYRRDEVVDIKEYRWGSDQTGYLHSYDPVVERRSYPAWYCYLYRIVTTEADRSEIHEQGFIEALGNSANESESPCYPEYVKRYVDNGGKITMSHIKTFLLSTTSPVGWLESDDEWFPYPPSDLGIDYKVIKTLFDLSDVDREALVLDMMKVIRMDIDRAKEGLASSEQIPGTEKGLKLYYDHLKKIEALLVSLGGKEEDVQVPEKVDARRDFTATTTDVGASKERSAPVEGLSIDLGGGITMEFVLIPAGSFYMGSPAEEKDRYSDEGPVRRVQITKPFYIGKYEVTQAQYKAVVGSNPSHFSGADLPVESVSWQEAMSFCDKLTNSYSRHFRLPTEAEWEYACRAGSQSSSYYGDDPNYAQLAQYAWYDDNSDEKTHSVGQKMPNKFGLYDMYGNVWEWCSDWWVVDYENAASVDPTGPTFGTSRVIRGGSWYPAVRSCRSAARDRVSPDYPTEIVGFRVVLELE